MPLHYDPTVGVTRNDLKPSAVDYSTGHKEEIASVQSSGATPASLWALEGVLEETTVFIQAKVAAQETSDAERACYHIEGLFYRASGGALLQQGSTVSLNTTESDATYDCYFDLASPDVAIKVKAAAGDTTNWVGVIQYFIVTDA